MTDHTRPASAAAAPAGHRSPAARSPSRPRGIAYAAAEAAQRGSPRSPAASEAGTPPLTPTLRRKHGGGAAEEGPFLESLTSFKPAVAPSTPRALKQHHAAAPNGGRRPAAVAFGGCVLVLMLVGMAGSDLHLRLSKGQVGAPLPPLPLPPLM